jgi:hypothetical protein
MENKKRRSPLRSALYDYSLIERSTLSNNLSFVHRFVLTFCNGFDTLGFSDSRHSQNHFNRVWLPSWGRFFYIAFTLGGAGARLGIFIERTPMDLATRDRKLKCLEDILEQPRNDQNVVAVALFKIWHDGLWEVSDDSFDEFVQNEFEMSEVDAFIIMKAAASAGQFPEYESEKINAEFERLG